MKYVIITVLAMGALFTVLQLQTQPHTPKQFSQTELIDLAQRAPQTQVLASATIIQPISLRQLSIVAKSANVAVNSFTVKQDISTSGYVLQKGENLDGAISTYLRDHELFSQKRFQMQSEMLSIEKDYQLAKALQDSSDQINQTTQKESLVVSIEVTSSAQEIFSWQNINRNIIFTQVIDVSDLQTQTK